MSATTSTSSWVTLTVVAVIVAGAFVIRGRANAEGEVPERAPEALELGSGEVPQEAAHPRFLDLGSDRCRSCQAMIPVIEELRTHYATTLDVDFIDVWDHPEEGEAYGVSTIPTQILFDADGNELERHVGFWATEEIVARLEVHGYPQTRTGGDE